MWMKQVLNVTLKQQQQWAAGFSRIAASVGCDLLIFES
jgi:hypothetical protein